MISEWLDAFMRRAKYKLLYDDDGNLEGYFGEIPDLNIVIASGETMEACREELLSCLEDWLLSGVREGDQIPEIDGICLIGEPLQESEAESFMPVSNGQVSPDNHC